MQNQNTSGKGARKTALRRTPADARQESVTEEQATPAPVCEKCAEAELEREAQHKWDVELADQLADFMDNPGVIMDLWEFVGNTIEGLAERCDVGFHTPEVVRAAVPVILARSESRDMVESLLKAVEKRRAADAERAADRRARRREREGDHPREEAEPGAAGQGTGDAADEDAEPPARAPVATRQPPEAKSLMTQERITALVDTVITFDEDEKALAFIELLRGITDAAFVSRTDVEIITIVASQRAYAKTVDFNEKLDEFAGLARDDQRGASGA